MLPRFLGLFLIVCKHNCGKLVVRGGSEGLSTPELVLVPLPKWHVRNEMLKVERNGTKFATDARLTRVQELKQAIWFTCLAVDRFNLPHVSFHFMFF